MLNIEERSDKKHYLIVLLIEGWKGGKRMLYTDEEFQEIYHRNISMIYKISMMFLKKPDDAEDAVQSVFIELLKLKTKFESLEHEKAWLIVATQNHCKNIVAHWWKKKRTDLEKIPEPVYLDDNLKVFIWDEILKLPDKYKIVVYLYYYEGYQTEEIGEILGINSSTIRTQLSTARKLLKPVFKEVNYVY